jgi:hypothetical protein
MLTSQCAMTVNTRVVQLFLRKEHKAYVSLEDGLRLQILPSISFLPQCQKHHFAAFIQDSAVLVVWDDQPRDILSRVQGIEDQLMRMIWNNSTDNDERLSPGPTGEPNRQTIGSIPHVNHDAIEHNEKMSENPRKTVLVQPILTSVTIVLIIAAMGTGVRRMMIEVKVEHDYLRLALLVVAPLQVWLALVRSHPIQSAWLPLTEE